MVHCSTRCVMACMATLVTPHHSPQGAHTHPATGIACMCDVCTSYCCMPVSVCARARSLARMCNCHAWLDCTPSWMYVCMYVWWHHQVFVVHHQVLVVLRMQTRAESCFIACRAGWHCLASASIALGMHAGTWHVHVHTFLCILLLRRHYGIAPYLNNL